MKTFVKFEAVMLSKWESEVLPYTGIPEDFPYTSEFYIQPENVTRIHRCPKTVFTFYSALTEICLADGFSFVVEMDENEVLARLGCKSL